MNEYLVLLNSIEQYWLFAGLAGCLLVILVLIICIALNARRVKKLEKKLREFTSGSDGASLESEIGRIVNDNKVFREELTEHSSRIDDLYSKHETTIQKAALVKYDAFKEMGGKLSSVTVLLDGHDDGVLINVVHSTSGSYTYTKKINRGQCNADLGTEEREALEKAMNQPSEAEKKGTDSK